MSVSFTSRHLYLHGKAESLFWATNDRVRLSMGLAPGDEFDLRTYLFEMLLDRGNTPDLSYQQAAVMLSIRMTFLDFLTKEEEYRRREAPLSALRSACEEYKRVLIHSEEYLV